ncbi:MAG: hypothetical protein M3Q98_14840 [Actinomycetota bacterium]|nr:hypothetical protein [Actinomycetota bacterium]
MNGKPALIPFGDAGAATCEGGVCGVPTAVPAQDPAKSHPGSTPGSRSR